MSNHFAGSKHRTERSGPMHGDHPHPKTVRDQAQPSGWRRTYTLPNLVAKFRAPAVRKPMNRKTKDRTRELGRRIRAAGVMTKNDLDVFEAILDHHNTKSGACNPAYETIADRADCSRRSVPRSNQRLEALGLIGWTSHYTNTTKNGRRVPHKTANQYHFADVEKIEEAAALMNRAELKAKRDAARRIEIAALDTGEQLPLPELNTDQIDRDFLARFNAAPPIPDGARPHLFAGLNNLATYIRR